MKAIMKVIASSPILQVGDTVECGCYAGDGRVGDPQDLDGQVDEHEDRQHHPAVRIQAEGFSRSSV